MDGLVTKALADMIRVRFGAGAYADAARAAGLDGVTFAAGEVYPDETTYALVAAAAERAGTTQADVLESLGEHWVEFAIREGYGQLLTTAGRTFRDVLLNLNRMHDKITLRHAHVQQPTFWCTDLTPDALTLHYASARPGLAPLVIGIVRGLAKMHATRIEIEHRRRRSDGAAHDEFVVRS